MVLLISNFLLFIVLAGSLGIVVLAGAFGLGKLRLSRPDSTFALLSLFCGIMFLIWYFWSYRIFKIQYDQQMQAAWRQFEQIEPPPNTKRLAMKSQFGLIYGNSNHCDFFIGILISSGQELQQLRQYYSHFNIQYPAVPVAMNSLAVAPFVTSEKSSSFNDIPYDLQSLASWKVDLLKQKIDPKKLFVVYASAAHIRIQEKGRTLDDLRCH